MKKSLTRKLILSIVSATATGLCLTSTTFAWFATNQVVWTEETTFTLNYYDGLLISFDGKEWHDNVTSDELYQSITGLDKDAAKEAIENLKFDGVSPTHTTDGKISYDEDGYMQFERLTVDQEAKTTAFAAATANEHYITFPLYFRIVNGGTTDTTKTYDLKFTENTYVKSNGTTKVKLNNKLTTFDENGNAKELGIDDEIELDAANAFRLGIMPDKNASANAIVYETPNDLDHGSAAIDGATDYLHDPSKNAMFTYYNNFFSEKLEKAATSYGDNEDATNVVFGEAFNTDSVYTDDVLGKFEGTLDSDTNEVVYNDVKIQVYLWLEGWDADYIWNLTGDSKKISTFLEFKYELEE